MVRESIARKPRRFTDRQLQQLKPRDTRYELTDATGLMVRIAPNGKRSFWHVYKLGGQTRRHQIGTYEADAANGLTLADANADLAKLREQINQGIDPKTGLLARPGQGGPGT